MLGVHEVIDVELEILVLKERSVIGLEPLLEERHEVQVLKIRTDVLVALYYQRVECLLFIVRLLLLLLMHLLFGREVLLLFLWLLVWLVLSLV